MFDLDPRVIVVEISLYYACPIYYYTIKQFFSRICLMTHIYILHVISRGNKIRVKEKRN